jgi:hypothetical protein
VQVGRIRARGGRGLEGGSHRGKIMTEAISH